MSEYLMVVGGAIFAGLGLLHAIYTFGDMHQPRHLAPADPDVVARMAASGLRLSRGRTNMWDAWLGFNYSHSLGAVIFGCLCMAAIPASRSLGLPRVALVVPIVVGVLYFVLAVRFWFRAPAIGIGTATVCLLLGWLLY